MRGFLSLPSPLQALTAAGGPPLAGFYQFWNAVRQILSGQAGIIRLPSYTVAALPSAADNQGGMIYVSNGTANKRFAVSDGTNWRFPDGNVVT